MSKLTDSQKQDVETQLRADGLRFAGDRERGWSHPVHHAAHSTGAKVIDAQAAYYMAGGSDPANGWE